MHRLTILYIIFFLFVSTSIWLTNHIYIFCSQSLTNLISVLFSGLQSSEKVFHKKVMFYTNPFTSRPILHNQTPKIIIDFSPFKYSLKIFAAPLFCWYLILNVSPFPLQWFEEISTLQFYSAPDITMWHQFNRKQLWFKHYTKGHLLQIF